MAMVMYIIKYSIKVFSTGRWEDTPVFNLNNNDIVQLTAGFTIHNL